MLGSCEERSQGRKEGGREGEVREEENSTLCCRDKSCVVGWCRAEEREKK